MTRLKVLNILLKTVSIICSVVGFFAALFGLVIGLLSIRQLGDPGWGGIGVIFLMPSVIALIVIIFDFLISIGVINKGFLYSCIITIIKIMIIASLIPNTIYDYKYEIKFGHSNLDFDIIIIVLLIIVTIPSILNIIKLKKNN